MNELLFLGNLGTGEIVIIAIVVLLLFGGKKIPELMKGIGKGVKNSRTVVKGLGRRYQIRRYGKEVKEDATRRNVILGSPRRLRWTLFRSILALFVFAIAGFSVMPWLFDNVVMAPCSSDFIVYREMCKISSHFSFLPDFCNDTFHVNIVNIKLASQFFTHMTSSFWLALLLTFPYLMWRSGSS